MAFLNDSDIEALGFKYCGRNVRISTRAAIYDADRISIGDNSRIDDFAVLAGAITIGRNVHVTVMCNLAGGRAGIEIGDFSTLAYRCDIVAQSDDYTGSTMTNSTVPAEYKRETSERVVIGRHVILGTATIVLPGLVIGDGAAAGAGTLFTSSAEPWSIYIGSPARRSGARSRDLLEHERRLLAEENRAPPGI